MADQPPFSFTFTSSVDTVYQTIGKDGGYVVTMHVVATNRVLGISTRFSVPFFVVAEEGLSLTRLRQSGEARLAPMLQAAAAAVPST